MVGASHRGGNVGFLIPTHVDQPATICCCVMLGRGGKPSRPGREGRLKLCCSSSFWPVSLLF
ncbi:hypothetical protein BS50DRAFT_83450 [Corynespora cassiicola Philippines]|uniref:Uncharacterized protein n=1 Tax=Corynespora cassiicola Philippines TaxID=1448308 RepID=A0A2T2NDN1_CORCC|nr:hypothetical protein BS50DRAFT_83450 [Corynespora cassiicola Philippines]